MNETHTRNLEQFDFDVRQRIQRTHVLEGRRDRVVPQTEHQLDIHASTTQRLVSVTSR